LKEQHPRSMRLDVEGCSAGCDIAVSAYDAYSGVNALYVVFGKAGGFGTNFDPTTIDGTNGFVVTLDYDHNRLFLKPVSGPIPDLDTFDRSGMWINAEPGGFKVISVTKGGPAESAGVKEGDLITAIDGRAVTEAELPTVRMNWRNQPPGTVVPLKIERGSNSRAITLVLKNMI